jgi:carboxypeptidase C (cathepsin A)
LKRTIVLSIVVVSVILRLTAQPAQKPAALAADVKASEKAVSSGPERSVTQHKIIVGGMTINYKATAGMLIVRDAKDQPYASIGYFAYARNDVADPSRRPITFAYNGGPGSPSVWLHMGALGPKRVVTTDAAPTPPPPLKIVDNEWSLLDRTDLVLIDPVGTGFSRAVGEAKDKDFWGVDPDIESVSRFITQYITETGRWNSPKYLLGESYGTTRSAGVVDYLQSKEYMSFNGVILVSLATDLDLIIEGNIEGAKDHNWFLPLWLPTYTAVAWCHKALPERPAELAPLLDEVRAFALGEYARALALGGDLSPAGRKETIEKLRRYTGLSLEYLERADLEVSLGQFAKELFRGRRDTVGLLDARFLGVSFNPLGESAEFDPMDAAISPAFLAAFMDYLHRELNFGREMAYRPDAGAFESWDFKHKIEGLELPQQTVGTGVNLAHAMGTNPHLKVLVLQGIYDLVTPLLATEYMVSHLGLRPDLRPNIGITYYDAGHMMYLHEPSLRKFKSDVAAFIDATAAR